MAVLSSLYIVMREKIFFFKGENENTEEPENYTHLAPASCIKYFREVIF